ncbi:TetR/AcrR family transcriptional regulator [Nocardia pseudobrasiliensis]|uniref:TetR family transcriptional regulator n=1 Tax=Nocardia pseudobrasiliensis TaxID=45979 RepID=A0A370I890_9NOCA|nr:TetR/AcrR family transcriptional regulator [Nocardia pseudobrasiliensis]RDI66947.1 TetR family transcriptional regulator [Nocardia pseudobrasiliensis]
MESDTSSLTRTQRARRDDIVAAAIAVIDNEGFAAASVDRIARQAGAIKGTVLYHFKTKDAICEAVVTALYAEGAAFKARHAQNTGPASERLARSLRSNLEFICTHATHVRAVQRIIENAPHHRDRIPDLVEPLSHLLAEGQRSGEFARFDPLIVAAAIRAIIDASAYYLANSDDVDIDHIFSEVVQFIQRATAVAHVSRKEKQ